ncbi:MAG: glycine zipper domain-containing protein [Thermodesulfobacteriota bacterium]|nr:glycine zipper domain-containing protein [Thermodesulfobacteriota bacterium]
MKKVLLNLAIVTLILSGLTSCATTSDRTRTKSEGTAAGAAAGAFLGGIIGAISGDKHDALAGAAIGAVVGGAAGYAYGTHVANEKQNYASREDWLNACIASAEKVNQETRIYNAQLAQDISVLETETARLKAGYREREIQKSAMQEEKKKIEMKLAQAEEKLKRARYEKENQENVLAEAKAKGYHLYAKEFEDKIAELKGYIFELEIQTAALASLSQKMTV